MMKRIGKPRAPLAAVLALAGLCGGCAVGPDFKRPEPPRMSAYTRTPLAATVSAPVAGGAAQQLVAGLEPERRWWALFGSPALNQLVEQALAHNPTIGAAEAALRQAHANSAVQSGATFPTVQASITRTRGRNAISSLPAPEEGADPASPLYQLHTAQLSISYNPDVFGGNRRQLESLRATEEDTRHQWQAAQLTVASNLVAAVIQQAGLQAQIAATREIIESDRRLAALLRKQRELGAVSGLDVAAQEAALAQAEQLLPPLAKSLEQTRNLIAVLTGRLPAEGGREDFTLDTLALPEQLPLSLPSRLVERRPDVRAAEANFHAATAQVGVAVAARLPQFSITGDYAGSAARFAQMLRPDNLFWSLTAGAAQTLFDFGTLKNRQRGAEAAMDQAAAQYRSTVLQAYQNVADSLYAIDSDARALAAADAAEKASRRLLDLTRKQRELGQIDAIALLTAQTNLLQARVTRIQAQASRYEDTVALFQALGGGWDMSGQEVAHSAAARDR